MRIGLLGYGKMGQIIDKVAVDRGHQIVFKTDINNSQCDFGQADVAIDFSTPQIAFNNISSALTHKTPIVSGTTGWLKQFEQVQELCKIHDGAFLYSSNFSLGVNLFFAINKYASKIVAHTKQYKACVEEIHHTQKLDAPSGTAITLAEKIIQNFDFQGGWFLNEEKEYSEKKNTNQDRLPIVSKRIGDVPGTHHVSYSSPVDEITLTHKAHNRSGFALGAVIAAEFIVGKKGIFSMEDVLELNQ